ncbi:hypothetical protein HDV00_005603 [Rhizophlyctis rosea]|nr:hypothetical protein HDV00_005603 [Rhizophlyctis rosea]
MAVAAPAVSPAVPATPQKKSFSWVNLALGAGIQTFEVSTLGQPFEVVKTHMAGAVLLFASSELEYQAKRLGASSGAAGVLGGMGGGVAQAYTTMGFCTFMKTVEVTRHKNPNSNQTSIQVAREIFAKEGIRGLNKGVSAVAVRQMTNWGSRLGIARITESIITSMRPPEDRARKLSTSERLFASVVGGALGCWNQPIEVIRVEMQSQVKDPSRPAKMTIVTAAKWIWEKNGFLGFYRGITPRIGLGVYLTVCMVFGGDSLKAWVAEKQAQKK